MGRTLSRREQRAVLLAGGLAVGILWLYTAYILTPLMREGAKLGQQGRSARDELMTLERATANEAALRQRHRQVKEAVWFLRQSLPPEEDLPTAIEFLSNLASQSNLKIQAIFPQRRAEGEASSPTPAAGPPTAYTAVPIQIDALAGYHQLGTFVSLVESSQQPMRLLNLRVSSHPKEPRWHTVKLLINAYFATADPAATVPKG